MSREQKKESKQKPSTVIKEPYFEDGVLKVKETIVK